MVILHPHCNLAGQRQQFEGFVKELQHFCHGQYCTVKVSDRSVDSVSVKSLQLEIKTLKSLSHVSLETFFLSFS